MSDIGKWSVVASENNKPSPDGWPENMAPSDVNNSARENMAATKRMLLQLPYHSTGGVITYVNESTFTVADDELDSNYAKYFSQGRRVNVLTAVGASKGIIVTTEYANGLTTVTVAMDKEGAVFPADVTDVLVGLDYDDTSHISGPNMLGMVLPFTADTDDIPFGMGLADGEPFDPNLYKALAQLYYTGTDDKGNPTYRYGTTTVDGNIWPNKPDVRGYFPRFLDTRAETDGGKVDPDAPRTVGSTQEEATSADDLVFRHSTYIGGNNGGSRSYIGGFVYASGAERQMWRNDYNTASEVAIHSDANETRPVNIAFPGLLIMFGGYASATQMLPEDLVESAMEQIDPRLAGLESDLRETVNNLAVQVDEATTEQEQRITTAIDEAEARVEDIVSRIETETEVVIQEATTAADEAKTYAEEAKQATAGKQDKASRYTVIIHPADWSTAGEVTSYVAPISGLGANDLVMVSPATTDADMALWASCGVFAKTQAEGSITFVCKTLPNSVLTINVGVLPYDN